MLINTFTVQLTSAEEYISTMNSCLDGSNTSKAHYMNSPDRNLAKIFHPLKFLFLFNAASHSQLKF